MMLVDRLHESDHGWRWRTLAGSVIVTSACGLLYAFGLYSSELQRAANLTQAQLDLTVAMSQTGGNLGLHLGIMYDRVGPAPTLLFGAAFGFPSWLALFYALAASAWTLPLGGLLCLSFLQGHAQLLGDVVAVTSVMLAFPDHRGLAVGLAKTFLGLSGSLVAEVYTCFFAPDATAFLQFISYDWLAVCLLGALLVRRPPAGWTRPPTPAGRAEEWLRAALALAVALVVLLTAASLIEDAVQPGKGTTIGLGAVAFGLFLMLCLLLVSRREEPPLCAAPHAAAVRLVGSDDAPEAESASTPSRAALGVALLPRAREDVSLWQACLRSETYGLFIIETLIAGAGLVVINNLAQILTARAGDARSAATFVSLTSTGNAAGRLAVGAVGDHLVQRRSRTYALALAAALMLVGHLTLLIPGGSEALYVPCLLVGVAYGGMSAVIPPILAETFGTCQLAAIYALVCMGFALGLLLFASALVARVYEAAKAAAGISDDEPCVGMPCFRVTYVVCAAASAVAMLLALALASRESRRVD